MENVVLTEIKIEEVIMPRNDKTGSDGLGSMTGRRMGTCAGNESNDVFNFRGLGRRLMNRKRVGRGRNQLVNTNYLANNTADTNYKAEIENKFDALMERLSSIESKLKNK